MCCLPSVRYLTIDTTQLLQLCILLCLKTPFTGNKT